MDIDHEITTVPFPFNDQSADIVFKTADGVESMFDLPQNAASQTAVQGTAELPEDSKRLMNALRWCDHRIMPSMAVDDLLDALIVADKYDMTHITSQVQTFLREALKSTNEKDTYQAFAIAYNLRLEELLQAAAYRTIAFPFGKWPHVEEFALIPATAIAQLSKYRTACLERLEPGMILIQWSTPKPASNDDEDEDDGGDDLGLQAFHGLSEVFKDCGNCAELLISNGRVPGGWLKEYLQELEDHFQCDQPFPLAAQGARCAQKAEAKMAECETCKTQTRDFARVEVQLLRWFDAFLVNGVIFEPLWLESSSLFETR